MYQGAATTGDTIVRPASTYWHLDIPADQEFPFDPAGANAAAGRRGLRDTNGDGVREDPATGEPLELRMPASSDTTGAVDAGELIVGFLKQIGIKVDLLPATDSKMNDYWGSGNFDAYIWYWSGDPDPNYQLFVFTSEQCGAWSDGCWKDPQFDQLYEQQRSMMDQNAASEIVLEAQQYEYDACPGVVLAYPNWLEAYRNDRFTGWIPSPGRARLPAADLQLRHAAHDQAGGGRRPPSGSTSVPGWVWLRRVAVVVAIVRARRPTRTTHRAGRGLRSDAWGHGGTCSARRCRPS